MVLCSLQNLQHGVELGSSLVLWFLNRIKCWLSEPGALQRGRLAKQWGLNSDQLLLLLLLLWQHSGNSVSIALVTASRRFLFIVSGVQVVRVQPCKAGGTSGQREHKGRWRGMDAGVDASDDQVRSNVLNVLDV